MKCLILHPLVQFVIMELKLSLRACSSYERNEWLIIDFLWSPLTKLVDNAKNCEKEKSGVGKKKATGISKLCMAPSLSLSQSLCQLCSHQHWRGDDLFCRAHFSGPGFTPGQDLSILLQLKSTIAGVWNREKAHYCPSYMYTVHNCIIYNVHMPCTDSENSDPRLLLCSTYRETSLLNSWFLSGSISHS